MPRYWCHTCKGERGAEGTEEGYVCRQCNGCFVEVVETDSDRRDVDTFTGARAQAQRTGIQWEPVRGVPGVYVSLPMQGFAAAGTLSDFDLPADLLHMLHQTAEGPAGSPPASAAAIDSLFQDIADLDFCDNMNKKAEHCTVCMDGWKADERYMKMPCGHHFHTDCITPWLERHNSCPTCRFELPTDDPDYEDRRMQRA
eukprot:TRINITY_DN9992_c0_g1_i1.p1 TRINITY_DN9992_c0_g1~~TRINITY_DN9992_c0_g1_i1.p1  ORF type:complete len:199 (+),score=69.16 TRINITY_DN9992_c0_g1_i1:296-892(+)